MTINSYKHTTSTKKENTIDGYYVQELIGKLLFEERRKRNKTIKQVSSNTKILPKTIDEIEIARCKPHWDAIAKLLKFYDKKLEIKIINKDEI